MPTINKKKPKLIIIKDGKIYKPDPKKMMMKPPKEKMSGGMAIGGGHKNYKMTGKIKS